MSRECGQINCPCYVQEKPLCDNRHKYHEEPCFLNELQHLINRHSLENGSNTPDYILAEYLGECMMAFDRATKARDKWYGVELYPGKIGILPSKGGRV